MMDCYAAPCGRSHGDSWNLVDTGVTRGRRLVVLVGQRKALAIAVRGSGQRRR